MMFVWEIYFFCASKMLVHSEQLSSWKQWKFIVQCKYSISCGCKSANDQHDLVPQPVNVVCKGHAHPSIHLSMFHLQNSLIDFGEILY